MNDPHVVSLFYKNEHDSAVDYSAAEPVITKSTHSVYG